MTTPQITSWMKTLYKLYVPYENIPDDHPPLNILDDNPAILYVPNDNIPDDNPIYNILDDNPKDTVHGHPT